MVFITKFARIGVQAARQLRATPLATSQWRSFHITSMLDKERRYTDKHEWVELLDATKAIVGISNYAQEALGDVVFAQLPEPGTELKQDDECGALESVKAASEVYSPVSGKVTEKNAQVEDTPALVNSSCYDKGWLFKVDLKNPTEYEKLMTEEQYSAFVKSSAEH
ncbi:glycine cleavage system H protein, mitochondrial [Drosophila subobscura]|uniref:glycine cleavage system H protein, mitochondrial n=1 Tax=Drosophila subobscura TaxID=7241 RepID=UPI00155B01A1|nr:glycine cleavage system H protein, mitochondrial [Drosophila subobscura]